MSPNVVGEAVVVVGLDGEGGGLDGERGGLDGEGGGVAAAR
jgi:hypothetical protein